MSHDEFEKLRTRMRELASDAERYLPPPKLETVLCERFRRYHRGRRIRQSLVIGTIAACLAILFAGGTLMIKRLLLTAGPAAVSRPPVDAPVKRVPEPRHEIAADTARPARLRAVPRGARQRRVPQANIALDEVNHEVTTGFIPVGLGAPFGPGERGSLVRVRLPRSALAAFGLPMNENRVADVVNADVLLGEDGLARAIRFVQ